MRQVRIGLSAWKAENPDRYGIYSDPGGPWHVVRGRLLCLGHFHTLAEAMDAAHADAAANPEPTC